MDMRVARTMTVVVVVTMIMRVAGMVMMTVMVVAAQFERSPEAAKSGAIVGVSRAPSRGAIVTSLDRLPQQQRVPCDAFLIGAR